MGSLRIAAQSGRRESDGGIVTLPREEREPTIRGTDFHAAATGPAEGGVAGLGTDSIRAIRASAPGIARQRRSNKHTARSSHASCSHTAVVTLTLRNHIGSADAVRPNRSVAGGAESPRFSRHNASLISVRKVEFLAIGNGFRRPSLRLGNEPSQCVSWEAMCVGEQIFSVKTSEKPSEKL
jgi:hypothetical protein